MAVHSACKYNLITFDKVTPFVDFDSGFPGSAGKLSPFQDDLPSCRHSTPADTHYMASMSGLQEMLLHGKQSLASVEKRLHTQDSQLYETVEEMAEKLRTLKLSQMTRDEELTKIEEHICLRKMTQTMLPATNKPLVPSPPEPIPRQIRQPSCDLRAVTLQDTQDA